MRIVLQRTTRASVTVDGHVTGAIEKGLVLLIGVETGDAEADAEWLLNKVINMRIFSDPDGKMNLSVRDVNGGLLLISQFTLHASTKKGNRPSFIRAAAPDRAEQLYDYFIAAAKKTGLKTGTGVFGAHMLIDLVNDGPVTIFMDSKSRE